MRILHTSDWHLGRNLETHSLYEAQSQYLDHLVEVIKENKVDLLIVAGDVYDRAQPNAETIDLLDKGLSKLVPLTKVFITSGNHDSPQRLGFGSKFMESSGLYLRTSVSNILNPLVIEENYETTAIYGIPYLEPAFTIDQLCELTSTDRSHAVASHQTVMQMATDLIRKHASENGYTNTVVVSHAWFAGEEPITSERSLAVGGLANVSVSTLKDFTYSALGHIHKPMEISQNIHYCGTPMKFSFSEVSHTKHSLLVDIVGGNAAVKEIPTPVWREMAEIEGTLDEMLTSTAHAGLENHWIKATLKQLEIPSHAMERLRARFPNIVKLVLPQVDTKAGKEVDFEHLDLVEFCCDFVNFSRGETKPVDEWEKQMIQAATEEAKK